MCEPAMTRSICPVFFQISWRERWASWQTASAGSCSSSRWSWVAERLNEEERHLLNVLTNAQQEIDRITAMENFMQGFRLGVQLMVECLTEPQGGNANG